MKTDGLFTVHNFRIPVRTINEPIRLVFFGDVHRDSPNHAKAAWREQANKRIGEAETEHEVSALIQLDIDISEAQEAIRHNDSRAAVRIALRIGMRWMAILARADWQKGGRKEDAIWQYIREIYNADPKQKQISIIKGALASYQKDTKTNCPLSESYLEKHFKRVVKKR